MARTDILVRGLVAGHKGVPAVRGLDLRVESGEVVALLGPNGAGKSTTLWTLAGLLPPLGGDIEILGQPSRGRSATSLARSGVAMVPEDRGLFQQLSVAENFRLRERRGARRVTRDVVLDYLPALRGLMNRKCGLLSGGEQQMLALGCALASEPKTLMIDEMSLGLAPIIVEHLLPIVRKLALELDMSVLLVEQHVDSALKIADRGYVLSHGQLVLEGKAADLLHRRDVLVSSYLGVEAIE